MAKINRMTFIIFFALILLSGFGTRLGFSNLASWPWTHQWYMFSRSSNFLTKLQVIGYANSYTGQDLSLDDFFAYSASRLTHRAEEMYRTHQNLLSLTEFLCRKNPQLTSIKINQNNYVKEPGRIPDLSSPPYYVDTLLRPTSCQRESDRAR